MKENPEKRDAGHPFPASTWLAIGRFGSKAGSMIVGAHPKHWMKRWHLHHDRMMSTFGAIRNRVKSIVSPLPEKAHVPNEPDWLRAIKLCAKIGLLTLQLFYSRMRIRKLTGECSNLRVQRDKLLLGKGNALVFNGPGCDVADDVFNGLEHKQANAELCHRDEPVETSKTQQR